MKKIFIFLFVLINIISFAEVLQYPTPVSSIQNVVPVDFLPEYILPPIDVETLLKEDEQNAGRKDIPFRYGAEINTQIDLLSNGFYEQLENGDYLIRIKIRSYNAYSLSFQFKPFHLPEGSQLFIYSPDKAVVWGPYTSFNNKRNEFWTPAVPYDCGVIELYLPAYTDENPLLTIKSTIHAYKNNILKMISPDKPNPGGSGSCNVDVECERAQWSNEINSVAHYTFGIYMCTGTLINRIPGDCVPYFWTANHCVNKNADASKVVTYWNFERSSCGSGTGPTNHTVGNSTLIWNNSTSDGSLLQLDYFPPDSYTPYLAGWDAVDSAPNSATCIHHPSGDYKKISHENNPLTITSYLGNTSPGDGTHLRVADWDSGTTEGGSSGSGLWNNSTRRLVGQLHGGYAACGNNSADWFGRFKTSYDLGAKTYLDPSNTQQTYVNGKNYTQCIVCNPPNAPSGLTIVGNCDSVSLSWTGSGATGYNIYRKTGTCGGTYTQIANGITTTTYNDAGVTPGSTYSYIVKGYSGDVSCESADSNCVSTTVQTTPSAPAAPTVSDSCDGLLVSWSSASGATSYNVYRRTGGCGNNGWGQIAPGITSTSWTDTNASLGTTYGYYIEAVNVCGTATNGKNACGSGTHNLSTPSAPIQLTATGTCTSIDLTWNASTGATSYNILRTTNSNCSTGLTQIGTSTTTSFSDTNAQAGTTYYYVVQAVNSCGTSSNSNCANAVRSSAPSQPSITNITDESSCAQSGIRVYYNAGSGATSHSLYKDGSLAQSNYTSGALYNPGDTNSHSYFIRATNSCGSADSTTQNFTDTNNSTTPTITGPSSNTCPSNSVLLSTESGMTNYQWYLNGNPISGANAYQYTATQSGNYTVSYTNSFGCSGTSAPKSITINPCIPNIVYYSNGGLVSINEDGDGIPEAGEKWQMTVTVINNGQAPATNAYGNLAGEGITLCNAPGYFGNIDVNQTSSYTFIFIIDSNYWYSTYSCGSSIGFDLINKSSNGGAYNYADDLNFLTQQVGQLGGTTTENATGPDITNVKDNTKTSTFSPSFTLTPNVDSATVSFTLSGTTNLVNCVLVELLVPDSSALILKNYGETAQSSYNVTSFYNLKGAGPYTLRVTEASGCGAANENANCSSISMSVSKTTGSNNCDTSSFSCLNIAGEVSDDSAHYMKINKNGTNISLQFEDIGAQYYNIYVSNNPNTHSFLVSSTINGKKDCHITIDNDLGDMLEVLNYNLESGITGDTSKLFILISADNGSGTEGSIGFDSANLERSSSSYCNK